MEFETVKEAFKSFDTNGDGTISKQEAKVGVESLDKHWTDEQVEEAMKKADRDGDGKVNIKEFVRLLLEIRCSDVSALS